MLVFTSWFMDLENSDNSEVFGLFYWPNLTIHRVSRKKARMRVFFWIILFAHLAPFLWLHGMSKQVPLMNEPDNIKKKVAYSKGNCCINCAGSPARQAAAWISSWLRRHREYPRSCGESRGFSHCSGGRSLGCWTTQIVVYAIE